MKTDALTNNPGLIPNAGALHREIVKAVSYMEVMQGLQGAAPSQGAPFTAYLDEVNAYLVTVGVVVP